MATAGASHAVQSRADVCDLVLHCGAHLSHSLSSRLSKAHLVKGEGPWSISRGGMTVSLVREVCCEVCSRSALWKTTVAKSVLDQRNGSI